MQAHDQTPPSDPAIGMPLRAREHPEAPHPTDRKYIGIAVILAVVTAAEVAIYYVESLRDLLVPILLGMMVAKFSMVALWFMHLKFDNPGYSRLFAAGIALAATVYVVVLLIFGWFG